MEKNLNTEYKGFKANGFFMLFVSLAIIAGSIWGIIYSANLNSTLMVIGSIIGVIIGSVMLCGLMVIEPNQARVMVFFGKYRGNLLDEGFWWVNPFMSVKKISLRARNLNADPIKVNDKMGNPIMIGLVLVWKVKANEIYKAIFNIDAPKQVITTTTDANKQVNINAAMSDTTEACASLEPNPKIRPPSCVAAKGSLVQLSRGFTVSICELSNTVGLLAS